jgi:hypothetical protein
MLLGVGFAEHAPGLVAAHRGSITCPRLPPSEVTFPVTLRTLGCAHCLCCSPLSFTIGVMAQLQYVYSVHDLIRQQTRHPGVSKTVGGAGKKHSMHSTEQDRMAGRYKQALAHGLHGLYHIVLAVMMNGVGR